MIAFATHGLLAGDLKGVAEPALVLTPPAQGTERDDGLLTASEVAQLKLGAEWVILSACNTAAPDGTPGAEGLSGLVKAFLYAGGCALLVSHWPVVSAAATEITTRLFEERAGTAEIGRAEVPHHSPFAYFCKGLVLMKIYSGATRLSGRFGEGLLLRRSQTINGALMIVLQDKTFFIVNYYRFPCPIVRGRM